MFYPLKLAGRVDRAAQVDENDTLQTKSALKALGHYKTPAYGMTPYPDEPMFDGIKAYQKVNKLKVDGVMKPRGETERSMRNKLSDAAKDKGKGSDPSSSTKPVIKPPKVDPNMPVYKDRSEIQPDPKGIYSEPFVDDSGNPRLNGLNPKTGKIVWKGLPI